MHRWLLKYEAGGDPTIQGYGATKDRSFAISDESQRNIEATMRQNPDITPSAILKMSFWANQAKKPSIDTVERFMERVK